MRFSVVPPRRQGGSLKADASHTLMQDFWDDFGFKTQYHLYVREFGSEPVGAVKILKKGQGYNSNPLIERDFDSLDDDFVSVGGSLDYYQNLARLGVIHRNQILDALRDVSRHPELQSQFEPEEGWANSLFRYNSDAAGFLNLARALTESDYTSLPSDGFKFSFSVTGWERALTFDFGYIPPGPTLPFLFPGSIAPKFPGRLIALIGRNGSGKSTLLARLARVAYGTATQRSASVFAELGTIEPSGIGFTRIITVSYSAFDSFTLPGLAPQHPDEPDQRAQILNDVRQGEGRFIFCGLRDIASELEAEIEAESKRAPNAPIPGDRAKQTLLKSIDSLGNEFAQTIDIIRKNNRWGVFIRELNRLVKDSTFSQWNSGDDLAAAILLSPKVIFEQWSSGQKIVVQVVARLVAHTTALSLVLIDEPETHLHPPLIAALMHAVRDLLETYNAFCVVATHSPIVVQESMARDVYLVRREGAITDVSKPTIQTFGENIGALTSEVFGVNSEVTDFHHILDTALDAYAALNLGSALDRIEEQCAPHGLSLQARAYVMSRLASKGRS